MLTRGGPIIWPLRAKLFHPMFAQQAPRWTGGLPIPQPVRNRPWHRVGPDQKDSVSPTEPSVVHQLFRYPAEPLTVSDLTATTGLTFTPVAAMNGIAGLTATTTLSFAPVATLAGVAGLSATSGLTFTPTASLRGVAGLTATSGLTFTSAGTVGGVANITGSIALTFAPVATLRGVAGLAGTSGLTFLLNGSLYVDPVVNNGRFLHSFTHPFAA